MVLKFFAICVVAASGVLLAACGEDEDDQVTVPVVTVEVAPTEGATTTTPTPPAQEETATDPSDVPAEGASPAGEDKGKKDKGKKVDKPPLPKCSELGEAPTKCRRADGTVRVPERL